MSDPSFLIIAAITGILMIIGYRMKGVSLPLSGLMKAWEMLVDIAPNFLVGFAMAGLVQVLIPKEYVAKLLGEGSGLKGILIATAAGALAPGGPFINVPLVASFYKSGASVGPLSAFLTAWSIIPVNRIIVYEIPLLGTSFAFARYVASLAFPIVIGMMTSFFYRLFR